MFLSLKIVLGSVMAAGIMGLIVVGAFVMNPILFLESEEILVSNSLYLSAPRDSLRINDVSLVGNKLVMKLSYGGGCKDHVFQLIASDEWLESYPVQTPILLSHEANDDPCEAFFTERFIFDLSPLKDRYQELYRDNSATIRLRIMGGSEMVPLEYKF
jgi:hypothetical protein